MGSMSWREVCRRCGGEAAVEMTRVGEGVSACGFCGQLDSWVEPEGAIEARGGNGCLLVLLSDSKTVSPGMSRGALKQAWRRLSGGSVPQRLKHRLGVLVVTRRSRGPAWSVGVRKGLSPAKAWSGRLRDARVLSALMADGEWSESLRDRLRQRRLAHRAFGAELTADLARGRQTSRRMAGEQGLEEKDDVWEDMPL